MLNKHFNITNNFLFLWSAFILALYSNASFAQSEEMGKPFLKSYGTAEYKAHTQNWAATQDNRGIMYFANTHGVLIYDGSSWDLIRVSNKSTVRSLDFSKNGDIYVGAVNEFGFLRSTPKWTTKISLIASFNR